MKGPAKLPETNLVSIHEAKVTSLVWIDGVELHVGGLGEGGIFVAHKAPGEGTYLIKVQLQIVREDVGLVTHILIPVVYPNDSLWRSFDFSRSRCWDVHYVVQSKLDGTILEEVQYRVGMLNGGGDSILFPPLQVLVMRYHRYSPSFVLFLNYLLLCGSVA